MNQPLPVVKGTLSDVAAMAKSLSIEASEIEQTGLPIEIIYNGIPMMVVPVASRGQSKRSRSMRARSNGSATTRARKLCWPSRRDCQSIEFCPLQSFRAAAGVPKMRRQAQQMERLALISFVTAWWTCNLTTILSEQGFEMNRPACCIWKLMLIRNKRCKRRARGRRRCHFRQR